jgi:hypothetical protein
MAIKALDRLAAAMERGAPEREITRLRARYELAESRACDQIDAFVKMAERVFGPAQEVPGG